VVQALLSEQVVPFGAFTVEQLPLAGLQTPAMWHESAGAQTTAVPPQTPEEQMSEVVQALPSLQVVPFGALGFEQAPVVLSQVPGEWHWSGWAQMVGVPIVQIPLTQMSVTVQASLSALQVRPSGAAGFEQAPVVVSQTPAMWHWSSAVQVFGELPTQAPDWHVSTWVQALPSLQVLPSIAAMCVHTQVA